MTDKKPDAPTLPDGLEMQTIASGHHSRAGHDAANNQLYIDFAKPGGKPNIYRYDNFTAEHYADYLAAESKGKHFLSQIKPQTDAFPFTRIPHVEPEA